ncbi:MAG: hypothetical protein JWL98_2152, partial [Xanthomonadaceae bacterium]|nr:hypothetical protein [Xanthomonadaceae bacterium]
MNPATEGTLPTPLARARWQLTAGLAVSLLLAAASAALLFQQADPLDRIAYPVLILMLGVFWVVLLRTLVTGHRRQTRLLQTMLAQAALLQETRRLASIGDWTWELDTDRVLWSEELYAIYDRSPPADGLDIQTVATWIHPDDRERLASYFAEVLGGGDSRETEYRIVRPDGEVRNLYARGEWVDRTAGRRVMRGIQQDITELASTRDRLRETQEEYAFLFEHNPLPMWVFERDSLRFLAVNASMLDTYGYSREELLAGTMLDIRPPQDALAVRKAALLESSQRPQGQVWTHLRKDGSRLRAAIHT